VTPKAYLAFDLGAESGRAILAHLEAGVIRMREIHRFPNTPLMAGDTMRWDVAALWDEMRRALPHVDVDELASIGVDTWGVDYALLGPRGDLLENPYHYRAARNKAAMEEALRIVPREDIYAATGVQFMPINTVYQLFAAVRHTPAVIAAAERLVMMPDLFNYWLTGSAVCEFTDATTSQLVNPITRQWASDLMDRLALPARLMAPIVEPGTVIGPLRAGTAADDRLAGTPVIAIGSHDTASAVAAITAREGTAFLSSGTWSLIGTEIDAPLMTPRALELNFSNEGGVAKTTRLLKNVMGLWLLQSCRRSFAAHGRNQTYAELMETAEREPPFRHLVDPDDGSFANPDDMPAAIDAFCRRTDQPRPATDAAYARTVFDSLALKYRLVLRDLEALTGRRIDRLRVIGGGSQNRMLNQLTADAISVPVVAGPTEATALGNVAVQMLATGTVTSLAEARAVIDRSFPAAVFEPRDVEPWNREAARFRQYCGLTYA
jgi:rhamnulokinase